MLLPEGELCFESLQEKNIIEIKIRKNSFLITVDFVQKVKNFLNFINLNTNCMKFLFTLILSATVFLLKAQTSAVLRDKADTIRLIRQTVSLYDLDFTDAEADSMLGNMNNYLQLYKGMHKTLPTNDIPYGLKDLFAVKGYKTTFGSTPYKDQVLDVDSYVYTELKKAGAVLCAKLSLGALAYNNKWFGGETKNPWDLKQGSSGSSAGSAAATVAGLLPFAIGTETLGSIVSPSTRCGATGLRPTFGSISRYGAMVLCWSLDKAGPISRSAENDAIVLSAINT